MGKTSNGESLYWFVHKAQSRNDVKLLKLDEYLGEHIGYALFFKALEVITELDEPYLKKDSKLHRKAMGLTESEFCNFIDCAISCGLFDITDDGSVFSPGYIKWLNKKNMRTEIGSKGGKATQAKKKANDEAKPQAKGKAKPVVKESLTPESEQITRLRGYAKAIFDEIGSSKNKPELSTDEYQKLIDKWGYDKLVILQRVFYEWKAIKKDKATATDFGTLYKKGWVHEKVDKLEDAELDMKNGSGKW